VDVVALVGEEAVHPQPLVHRKMVIDLGLHVGPAFVDQHTDRDQNRQVMRFHIGLDVAQTLDAPAEPARINGSIRRPSTGILKALPCFHRETPVLSPPFSNPGLP
jgi:hypothetical protein